MIERLQTGLILFALAVLSALAGVVAAGTPGLFIALGGAIALWLLVPQVPNAWVLRSVDARPLRRWQAPDLIHTVELLTARAGLTTTPALFVTPSRKPQAFTIGDRDDAAIVLSVGMTRALSARELTGVLAHEVTHVAHGDIGLLRFANILNNVTASLSRVAVLLAVVGLPFILTGMLPFRPGPFLLVLTAPWAAQALLLALSRTREHAADRGAAALTGDPAGLASALARLERSGQSLWHRLLGLRPREAPDWLPNASLDAGSDSPVDGRRDLS